MTQDTRLLRLGDAGQMAAAIEHLIALAHVGYTCATGSVEEVAKLMAMPGCVGPEEAFRRSVREAERLVLAMKSA